MKSYHVKSPTRIDLAGGTLDMWPLYAFVGDALTINLSVSVYTQADLHLVSDSSIGIISHDLNREWKFANLQELLASQVPEVRLYQVACEALPLAQGFRLETSSESPVGAGLAASSSLMISILKVLAAARHDEFGSEQLSVLAMMHLAHNLEAKLMLTPTGTQDYFPPLSPGLNFISYDAFGVRFETQTQLPSEFSERIVLVYTGRTHHSGLNNFEVLKSAVERNSKVLHALAELRSVALDMKVALQAQDFSALPQLFEREIKSRLHLTERFSSPEIDKIMSRGQATQAFSTKICGAGGGGCVFLFLRRPQDRPEVTKWLASENFQILNAKPVFA